MVPFAPGFFKPLISGRTKLLNGDVTVYAKLDYTTLLGGSLGSGFIFAYGQDSIANGPHGSGSGNPAYFLTNFFSITKWSNLDQGAVGNAVINGVANGGVTPQVSSYWAWTNKDFLKLRFVWRNGVGVYMYANDVLVYKNEYAAFTFEQAHPLFGCYGVFSIQDGWTVFRDIDAKEYGTLAGWTLDCRSGSALGAYEIFTGDGNAPGSFTQLADGLKVQGTGLDDYAGVRFL